MSNRIDPREQSRCCASTPTIRSIGNPWERGALERARIEDISRSCSASVAAYCASRMGTNHYENPRQPNDGTLLSSISGGLRGAPRPRQHLHGAVHGRDRPTAGPMIFSGRPTAVRWRYAVPGPAMACPLWPTCWRLWLPVPDVSSATRSSAAPGRWLTDCAGVTCQPAALAR